MAGVAGSEAAIGKALHEGEEVGVEGEGGDFRKRGSALGSGFEAAGKAAELVNVGRAGAAGGGTDEGGSDAELEEEFAGDGVGGGRG
jgi:hypothetical protein